MSGGYENGFHQQKRIENEKPVVQNMDIKSLLVGEDREKTNSLAHVQTENAILGEYLKP